MVPNRGLLVWGAAHMTVELDNEILKILHLHVDFNRENNIALYVQSEIPGLATLRVKLVFQWSRVQYIHYP